MGVVIGALRGHGAPCGGGSGGGGAVMGDAKIVSQFHSCFFAGQTEETGNKINCISVSLASEAMKTLIDFHTWVLVIVERADCHAAAVDLDAVHLSRLSGGNIVFYCFKYIQ